MKARYDKDNRIVYVDIAFEKRYENVARSEFPHPLVTLDFDSENHLLGIALFGVEEISVHND